MDTFMDKLAQKLTAQEMIQANAAADAEELRRIEAQVERYNACLEEIRKVNASTMVNVEQINTSTMAAVDRVSGTTTDAVDKVNASATEAMNRVNETTAEALNRMRSYSTSAMEHMNDTAMEALAKVEQALTAGLERLERIEIPTGGLNEVVENSLQQIREAQGEAQNVQGILEEKFKEQSDQLSEYVHKENVKVYRNVQAVVVEETNKQTEALKQEVEKLQTKLKGVNSATVVSIVFSVIAVLGIVVQLLFTLGIL